MSSVETNPETDSAIPFASLVPELRSRFPSLARLSPDGSEPVVYLDGPAGSQVPRSVIEAIGNYYLRHNANSGGQFATSVETNELIAAAHRAAADWFGANDPRECVFGANMTTLTMAFSRAISKTWKPGERVVVTQLDHDGNVTPWTLAAADAGVEVATVRVDPADATLDVDDFRRQVTAGTRLVALTCASNAVGSKPPIEELIAIAHEVGAEVYLDAVHYAPHGLIDVQAWEADYCVCSAYKFFGPQVGMLWGRLERLEALTAYKLRPAPQHSPGKWMTGTPNFAAIAGVVAAINYIASIGQRLEDDSKSEGQSVQLSRRDAIQHAFAAIDVYERELLERLMVGLQAIEGVTVYGITDPARFSRRVPTVACTLAGLPATQVAKALGDQGIFCWDGNYYAVDICRVLGQSEQGMVRLGILHTTTAQEIDRTLAAIARLQQSASVGS
ncbi:MAG: cysteine desulfurase-like protein [Pirellulaceae bacterium]